MLWWSFTILTLQPLLSEAVSHKANNYEDVIKSTYISITHILNISNIYHSGTLHFTNSVYSTWLWIYYPSSRITYYSQFRSGPHIPMNHKLTALTSSININYKAWYRLLYICIITVYYKTGDTNITYHLHITVVIGSSQTWTTVLCWYELECRKLDWRVESYI
jgi:hypothetical protein